MVTGKERLLAELWGIATARVTDFIKIEAGAMVVADTDTLTPDQQAAIAAIEKGPGGVKIKFYDKLKALELLGKYLGLFESGPDMPPSALLECLLEETRKEVALGDLPEVQPAATAGDDLVEPSQSETL